MILSRQVHFAKLFAKHRLLQIKTKVNMIPITSCSFPSERAVHAQLWRDKGMMPPLICETPGQNGLQSAKVAAAFVRSSIRPHAGYNHGTCTLHGDPIHSQDPEQIQ